jgi:hypothetical protein
MLERGSTLIAVIEMSQSTWLVAAVVPGLGSSQQGWGSRRWETSAVNCPFGRLAYPMRGEVTNRVLLGRKRHERPGIQSGRQRWERPGWQQTRRFEDHRMTAAAKSTPVLKSLNGFLWNSRPSGTGGKADVTGKETGMCALSL